MTLPYGRGEYVRRGQGIDVAGALAAAAMCVAHAVPAARGEWVTNEKRLLQRAGLRGVGDLVAALGPEPRRPRPGADGGGEVVRGHRATMIAQARRRPAHTRALRPASHMTVRTAIRPGVVPRAGEGR
ncbi:hypothetical protein ACNF49_41165 [Actinomadura sp. ATCC 39365]